MSRAEGVISNYLSNVPQVDPSTQNIGHTGEEILSLLMNPALVLATEAHAMQVNLQFNH